MSLQQQCLPLPHHNRRKRHHDSKSEEETEAADGQQTIIPQQISDLRSMDATTYLASVSAQASQLPSVFIAEPKPPKPQTITNNEDERKMEGVDEEMNEEAMWEGSAMSIQYLYSQRLKLIPPPTIHHLPPVVNVNDTFASVSNNHNQQSRMEEYSNLIIDNFSKLRLYLHQCRNYSKESNESSKCIGFEGNNNNINNNVHCTQSLSLKERKIVVPLSKDEYNWHIFCLGKDEACGNVGGYYDVSSSEEEVDDDDEDDKDEEEDGNNQKEITEHNKSFDKQNVPKNGYEPTTSLLCQLDQIIIRRVINHHIHYITKGYNMSEQRGLWIYALLARLEKPLHRDEASSLTTLLREMCRMRNELNVDDLKGATITCNNTEQEGIGILNIDGNNSAKRTLSILNTLIVIVGIYFEQCHSLDSIMKVI